MTPGSSTDKADNERFLLSGLYGVPAVVLTDPGDSIASRKSTHDGHAGQGRSGSPMASETTELDSVSTTAARSSSDLRAATTAAESLGTPKSGQ